MDGSSMQTVDLESVTRDPEPVLARLGAEQGYVVIPRLFSPERVAFLRGTCERILGAWRARDPISGQAGGPDATSFFHLNHPAYFRDHAADFPRFMDTIADPDVHAIARTLFQAEPIFRCTSLWMNPTQHGWDGNWHRDSQFLTKSDEEERTMIAEHGADSNHAQIQIALIPSDDIEIVPGSHLRWDDDAEFAIRKADGQRNNRSSAMPGALRVSLQPGDGVMFNSYSLHRGRYHLDRPRRTFMLTYSSPDSTSNDYFTNQPWFLEPGHLDGLAPPTRAVCERFIEGFKPFWLAAEPPTLRS